MPDDVKLAIMIEEYKTLRTEILQTLALRIQILSIGVAGIGVLIGSAAVALEKGIDNVGWVFLGIATPLLCMFLASIWSGEVRRGRRADFYMRGLSRRINAHIGAGVLQWCDELRDSKYKQMKIFRGHYAWTLLSLSLTSGLSALIGAFLFANHFKNWPRIADHRYLLIICWDIVAIAPLFTQYLFGLRSYGIYDAEAKEWPERMPPWPTRNEVSASAGGVGTPSK